MGANTISNVVIPSVFTS